MKAAAHGGFPADFTLPSNQPALQSVTDEGLLIIRIHPGDFAAITTAKAASHLMHEGSHALNPIDIVDCLYINPRLHKMLPGPIVLCNAANYEQVALDVLQPADSRPGLASGSQPALRKALAYVIVCITRAWLVTSQSRTRTQAGKPTETDQCLAWYLGGPLGLPVPPAPAAAPADLRTIISSLSDLAPGEWRKIQLLA